jgi:hypothetical protein
VVAGTRHPRAQRRRGLHVVAEVGPHRGLRGRVQVGVAEVAVEQVEQRLEALDRLHRVAALHRRQHPARDGRREVAVAGEAERVAAAARGAEGRGERLGGVAVVVRGDALHPRVDADASEAHDTTTFARRIAAPCQMNLFGCAVRVSRGSLARGSEAAGGARQSGSACELEEATARDGCEDIGRAGRGGSGVGSERGSGGVLVRHVGAWPEGWEGSARTTTPAGLHM